MFWFNPQSGLHRTHHEIHTKDMRFHPFQWFFEKHYPFLGNKIGYLLLNNFDYCAQFVFASLLRFQLENLMPSRFWMIYSWYLNIPFALTVINVAFRKSSSSKTSPTHSYALVRPSTLACRLFGQWTMLMSNSSINNNHQTNRPLRLDLLTK
jgi:hypothetical protein